MIECASQPLWINTLAFVVSAGAGWIAGAKLPHYADAIARHTGIGRAALGVLLLGGIVSPPEVSPSSQACSAYW